MPVILDCDAYGQWLDPSLVEPNRLESLLVPCADEQITARPVSTYVNRPVNDDPRCLEESQSPD